VYLSQRDASAARTETEQVLSVSPKNSGGHFLLGQILMGEGKPDAAVAEFRMVRGARPEFIPAYLLQARAHLLAKQTELAMDVLGKALEIKPDAPGVLRALAVLKTSNKDYGGAEEHLRTILEKAPTDSKTRLQLGDLLYYTGSFDKAETEYRKLLEKNGKDATGYMRLSRLYAQKGQLQDAEELLRRGLAENPDAMTLIPPLVQVLKRKQDIDAAERVCREAINKWPERGLGNALLGQLQLQKKQYGSAEEQLRIAAKKEPQWQVPYNVLVQLYLVQGKQKEAINELESLQKAAPENARVAVTLALLYEKDGDAGKAIATYRELLTHQPENWIAANNLACLLSSNDASPGQLEEALALVEQALRLRPEEPTVLDTQGWVLYQRGELDRALFTLEDALEKKPDSAEINYHAALVLHASERNAEAREKLNIALQQDSFADREAAEKLLALMQQHEN